MPISLPAQSEAALLNGGAGLAPTLPEATELPLEAEALPASLERITPSSDLVALQGTGALGDAMATLATTDYFATARVGSRAGPTPCTRAFAVVLDQPDAIALFGRLVNGASLPGRLYGLCGLWLTDKPAYQAAAPAFEALSEPIKCWHGCWGSTLTAREIIRSWDPAKRSDIDSGAIPRGLAVYAAEQR